MKCTDLSRTKLLGPPLSQKFKQHLQLGRIASHKEAKYNYTNSLNVLNYNFSKEQYTLPEDDYTV